MTRPGPGSGPQHCHCLARAADKSHYRCAISVALVDREDDGERTLAETCLQCPGCMEYPPLSHEEGDRYWEAASARHHTVGLSPEDLARLRQIHSMPVPSRMDAGRFTTPTPGYYVEQ
jgi:hypothetical protein